jgi:hypothetical protein
VVGHDPDSFSSVRGPDRPSTHHKRPDGVSLTLQVRADSVNPSSAESTDVLSENPTGSKLSHKPGELGPKPGAGTFDSFTFAGDADVLAGESSGNDVGLQPLKRLGCKLSHVFPDRDFGPVLSEHFSAEWLDFAEGDRAEVSRRFKSEAESADAAEDVEDTEHLLLTQTGPGGRSLRNPPGPGLLRTFVCVVVHLLPFPMRVLSVPLRRDAIHVRNLFPEQLTHESARHP